MRQGSVFSFLLLGMLALCAPISPQTANSVQQTASKSGSRSFDWTRAKKRELLASAQGGDAGSQMWLGCAYEQGWFGKTNFREALKWFRLSAEQGNADSQNSLGQMYEDGEGVTQNYTLAAEWYRRAAEHVPDFGGAGQARNNLGLLYMNGYGVPKDYVQAYLWFSLSGESNPSLQFAKEHMTPDDIFEADRLISDWKFRHAMPPSEIR
jgi:TPR repeat protein